jgi:MtN3 and saliva related transmembrane protein
MDGLTMLGLAAGCCSTFALLPQALKVWTTGKVDQISIGMLSLMLTGAILWLTYGLLRMDISIIWANAVALIFIIYMFTVKVKDMRNATS